jgi:hypothetical protein
MPQLPQTGSGPAWSSRTRLRHCDEHWKQVYVPAETRVPARSPPPALGMARPQRGQCPQNALTGALQPIGMIPRTRRRQRPTG